MNGESAGSKRRSRVNDCLRIRRIARAGEFTRQRGKTVTIRMMQALAVVAMAFLVAFGANAQVPPELARAEAASIEAWTKAPLGVRRAVFVARAPDGFGIYAQRPSSRFKAGEALIVYAEPVGYGWKRIGGDRFEFGFDVDFVIKEQGGNILAGKEDFAHLALQSYNRNREFMLTLTLDISGAPPGNYVLQYRLRDIASNKTASFELPFTIGG